MSNFEFQDILNVQYPNPQIENDFPDKILRAAQFAPFAARPFHGNKRNFRYGLHWVAKLH